MPPHAPFLYELIGDIPPSPFTCRLAFLQASTTTWRSKGCHAGYSSVIFLLACPLNALRHYAVMDSSNPGLGTPVRHLEKWPGGLVVGASSFLAFIGRLVARRICFYPYHSMTYGDITPVPSSWVEESAWTVLLQFNFALSNNVAGLAARQGGISIWFSRWRYCPFAFPLL